MAALSLALFAGSSFALAYNDFQTNIDRHDIDDYLGERPTADGAEPAPLDPSSGEDINVLILGSDTRTGEVNNEYGETPEGGQRSDTTMLAHISADRSRVEVVSIPRDSLVTVPRCMMADGTWVEERTEAMFNSAFAEGADGGDLGTAAACTIRTVEKLSGVLIDDFVIVDFAGFINVIDALGGVPMCIPEPINDEKAGLELSAGEQVLGGRDALGFARARYNVPGSDGSDIDRIGRQQELVAAIAREALSKNLLTDLPKLYRFLDAATSTLTTGTELGSIPTMAGLAYSLRGIDLENIVFETMPFDWAGNRVRPSADAEALWEALRNDEPIHGALNATGEEPSDEPTVGGTTEEPPEAPPLTAEPEATDTPICP
ncbi:LCP family protein [Georgenia satyanarayanai]|nr:LCP family protein [Georgenia satyanarayanai]